MTENPPTTTDMKMRDEVLKRIEEPLSKIEQAVRELGAALFATEEPDDE